MRTNYEIMKETCLRFPEHMQEAVLNKWFLIKYIADKFHLSMDTDVLYICKRTLSSEQSVSKMSEGSLVVVDNMDTVPLQNVFVRLKRSMILLYQNSEFAILMKNEEMLREMREIPVFMPSWSRVRQIQTALPAIADNLAAVRRFEAGVRPRVFAAVMTYNSAKYIEECIRSILGQVGEFDLEIGVFDDASSDNTVALVEAIQAEYPETKIVIHGKQVNEGYEKNYIRIFRALEENGCDFLTCIDGDDYLSSVCRIQKHLDEMARHPECAVSFNRLQYYYEDTGELADWTVQETYSRDVYSAFDLAEHYFIGNGSCSMVRRSAAIDLPDVLFTEAKIGDWFTHCTYGLRGDILQIKERMNVYRKHSTGAWSGLQEREKSEILMKSVMAYNKCTEYIFYNELYKNIADIYHSEQAGDNEMTDLLIVDDVFPHPVSGFRMEEFSKYLQSFPSVRIFANGASAACLGKRTHQDILAEYKQCVPDYADKVIESYHETVKPEKREIRAKLAYFCFLGNAYHSLNFVEANKIPFVFELYPGGSFSLGAELSDEMLRSVMNSHYFRKVIVTQDITKNYLLEHDFCSEDKIVEIFGVVTPEKALETQPVIHDRDVLKVCFAAMRYTPRGEDKGYDVFIETARRLSADYPEIEFHVAGGFDEYTIPLEELEGRVTFHGVLKNDDLSCFLQDMDIIVSPNVNGKISAGAFDGFPTGTCTEAGLNGVLIMCTDPLGLNNGRFREGEEIEIIQRDVDEIAEKIRFYNEHRDVLREKIRNQYNRIQQLYSTEVQIGGRISILEQEIEAYESNMAEVQQKLDAEQEENRHLWLSRQPLPKRLALNVWRVVKPIKGILRKKR